MPWVAPETVSRSGNRVALMRRRSPASSASGTLGTLNGRIVVFSAAVSAGVAMAWLMTPSLFPAATIRHGSEAPRRRAECAPRCFRAHHAILVFGRPRLEWDAAPSNGGGQPDF